MNDTNIIDLAALLPPLPLETHISSPEDLITAIQLLISRLREDKTG